MSESTYVKIREQIQTNKSRLNVFCLFSSTCSGTEGFHLQMPLSYIRPPSIYPPHPSFSCWPAFIRLSQTCIVSPRFSDPTFPPPSPISRACPTGRLHQPQPPRLPSQGLDSVSDLLESHELTQAPFNTHTSN